MRVGLGLGLRVGRPGSSLNPTLTLTLALTLALALTLTLTLTLTLGPEHLEQGGLQCERQLARGLVRDDEPAADAVPHAWSGLGG